MTSPRRVPIFDGHNDVLLRLYRRGGTDASRAFLEGEAKGQLDLPMARQGGFVGGLFAIFVPSIDRAIGPNNQRPSQNISNGAPLPPAVELTRAQRAVFSMLSLLLRIERESQGRVRVCRTVSDIQQGLEDGVLAPVLHIEGAEAIDPNFELLDVLHEAGLRSLGPVWSRSNAFGHGVPFRCPSSPNTGPGLTDLGKELIGACNRLRILIDLGDGPIIGMECGSLFSAGCTSDRSHFRRCVGEIDDLDQQSFRGHCYQSHRAQDSHRTDLVHRRRKHRVRRQRFPARLRRWR
jgi:membrane dipeptidase